MHTLHKIAERVEAADLPGVVQSLIAEGHTPIVKERGPTGGGLRVAGDPLRCVFVNPEPCTITSLKGERHYGPGETIVMVDTHKGVGYCAMKYRFGKQGMRPVTFRIYI